MNGIIDIHLYFYSSCKSCIVQHDVVTMKSFRTWLQDVLLFRLLLRSFEDTDMVERGQRRRVCHGGQDRNCLHVPHGFGPRHDIESLPFLSCCSVQLHACTLERRGCYATHCSWPYLAWKATTRQFGRRQLLVICALSALQSYTIRLSSCQVYLGSAMHAYEDRIVKWLFRR